MKDEYIKALNKLGWSIHEDLGKDKVILNLFNPIIRIECSLSKFRYEIMNDTFTSNVIAFSERERYEYLNAYTRLIKTIEQSYNHLIKITEK